MSTATLLDDPHLKARFGELKPALTPQAAVIEADRCLRCQRRFKFPKPRLQLGIVQG